MKIHHLPRDHLPALPCVRICWCRVFAVSSSPLTRSEHLRASLHCSVTCSSRWRGTVPFILQVYERTCREDDKPRLTHGKEKDERGFDPEHLTAEPMFLTLHTLQLCAQCLIRSASPRGEKCRASVRFDVRTPLCGITVPRSATLCGCWLG